MSDNNKSYRIKYDINNPVDHLNIKIDQDFDLLEVLSLSITQEDVYKLYTSNYGVVVGRVLANDGFGIPNAKISIFLPNNSTDKTLDSTILYPYASTSDKDSNGVRYNLLPSQKINKCHQNVGTLPSKRDVLDNNAKLEVFDNFYKYTTVTNASGDYMFFGIPTGSQQIHVDIDLSDIGILSQAPRDLEYQGYNIKQFDSPNKFKSSTNLDSLPQIISQDTTIFVYPFWGDESQAEIAISSKTINIQYQFEPTCVFMGSIFTDSQKSSISKTCRPDTTSGVMSELTASQGSIEMIRQTVTNTIEQFDINGTRLINNDGVWCYQIPMNLDYVVTDEYGNLVPTTDPTTGIPTRAKVRFRITLDDNGDSFVQSKTGVYLVPNKPSGQTEDDYEFNSNCKDSSFVDLMWNKVYSVKNYVPRIGESAFLTDIATDRHFNGLKSVNYHAHNNPAPYNNIWININLRFMLICLLTTFFIKVVAFVNQIIHALNNATFGVFGEVKFIIIDSKIAGNVCDVLSGYPYFTPINGGKGYYSTGEYNASTTMPVGGLQDTTSIQDVIDCVQINLAAENDVINFDFTNDWINGSLYAPRFLIKTNLNNKTGKQNSVYCGSWYQDYINMYLFQTCAPYIDKNGFSTGSTETISDCTTNKNCYKTNSLKRIGKGTISLDTVNNIFYYRSIEYPGLSTGLKYLYTTDIILLGSLNDCDQDGIPQLHQLLPSTSFKLSPDSFEGDSSIVDEFYSPTGKTMSGVDWGSKDKNGIYHLENGLFAAITCMDSDTIIKTCVNATRLCEVGVDFDERYTGSTSNGNNLIKYIDGYISTDEITDGDVRGMFATLNINNLKTKQIKYSQIKYDFTYNYPNGFDGRLRNAGIPNTGALYAGLSTDLPVNDYYNFRFGLSDPSLTGFDYLNGYSFPRYENSFYFYFGIKPGSTALDLFNNQYFVPCSIPEADKFNLNLNIVSNEGICFGNDGIIGITASKTVYPYGIYLNNILYQSNISSDDQINITGLTSQFYIIKVTDGNNDSVSRSIFLPKNAGINFNYSINSPTVLGASDGSVSVSNITNDNSDVISYDYSVFDDYYYTGMTGNVTTDNFIITGLTASGPSTGGYIIQVSESGCSNNILGYTFLVHPICIGSPVVYTEVAPLGYTQILISGFLSSNGLFNSNDNITVGVCYGLTSDPTIINSGTTEEIFNINSIQDNGPSGYYSEIITGLTDGTLYHARAYATNNCGVTSYGEDKLVTTFAVTTPIVTTTDVTYDHTTINASGNLIDIGGSIITEVGLCWAIYPDTPTLSNKVILEYYLGYNAWQGQITGLTEGTDYNISAYAINDRLTGFGDIVEITTLISSIPTVETNGFTDITNNNVYVSGTTLMSNGSVSTNGIQWSTDSSFATYNDTANNNFLHNRSTWNDEATGLTSNTLYYVRAYAQNEIGYGYGSVLSFTTLT